MTAETTLILRTCSAEMFSHGGFQWPESGPVEAPDWDPSPHCGNGLHGLLLGEGNAELLSWEPGAKWLVVEVDAESVVDLDGKVKFPRGEVVFCGARCDAVDFIADDVRTDRTVIVGASVSASGHEGQATASGYRGQATASGDRGQATASGHEGQAMASGREGQATASGHEGQATASGYRGQAMASGYRGQAMASGDWGQATASGYRGQATASGHEGQATASGYRGQATASGDWGQATASGDWGQATASGHEAQATASGHEGQATASGHEGQATAGEDGMILIRWYDAGSGRYRMKVGYIGEDGLEPNVAYRLNDAHEFMKVDQ